VTPFGDGTETRTPESQPTLLTALWIAEPTRVEKVQSEFAYPGLQGQTARENHREGHADGGALPSPAWRRALTYPAPLP